MRRAWAVLKAISAFAILAFVLELCGEMFSTPHVRLGPANTTAVDWEYVAHMLVGILAIVGIPLFIIDALLRSYIGPRGLPIGLAIGGVFSLGLSSLGYYLLWGRHPLRPPEEVYGTAFCAQCVATTTAQAAPGTHMINVTGSALIGNSDRCPECGSRIQTLWAVVVVPLLPFGSYRVIATGCGSYISRRTKVCWSQVLLTYAAGFAIGGPILYWIISSEWSKK